MANPKRDKALVNNREMSYTITPCKPGGINKSEIRYLHDDRGSPGKILPADVAINLNVEDSLP